jgi:hypothetical protein
MFFTNKVKEAVDKAGGPTYTAIQLKCAGTTIHAWVRNGRVSNIEKAKLLSELSGVAVKDLRPC